MRSKQQPQDDEALRKLLHSWNVTDPLPPRFEGQVWSRISRTELERPVPLWKTLAHLVERALSRPASALAYVSILLFAGAAGGYLHAQNKLAENDAALQTRYVQSVDPYQAPRNASR